MYFYLISLREAKMASQEQDKRLLDKYASEDLNRHFLMGRKQVMRQDKALA